MGWVKGGWGSKKCGVHQALLASFTDAAATNEETKT
jgi:hypothetical protein